MQKVQARRQKRRHIEFPPAGQSAIKPNEIDVRHLRSGCRQQGDSMPQLHQSPSQPHHDTLSAAVPGDRKTAMEVEGDVHPGPM
jgi:hypothetical protein